MTDTRAEPYPEPARAEAPAAAAVPAAAAAPEFHAEPARSQWADIWRQFRSHRGAVMGMGFLVFVTAAVLFGPLVWTIDPQALDIRAKDIRPVYTALWDGSAKVDWGHPLAPTISAATRSPSCWPAGR